MYQATFVAVKILSLSFRSLLIICLLIVSLGFSYLKFIFLCITILTPGLSGPEEKNWLQGRLHPPGFSPTPLAQRKQQSS